ncbi:MAG: M48 family metalloprotease [Gallionella sp.]
MALLLLLCLSPGALGDGLPDLGDVSQASLTPQQERQIGLQSMMQIRASKQYLNDSEVNDYLNIIGDRLVENSPEPALNFEFFAVNDYSVNAFALPGGFIGVNAGLILITQSESELASVLSHEISHVTQHHLARMIEAERGSGLISMAAIAVAILAARTNPQASEAAIASVQAGNIQRQLNFTRGYEEEADRIGLQLLEKSGFNTHAMPEFLRRLQKASRLLDGNTPNYMRTHPITSDRIAEIENRVRNLPYLLIPDSLDFQLVRTKLIAAQKSAPDAIAYFSAALGPENFGNPIAQRYGLVSSLLRDNQVAKASREMALLLKQASSSTNDMIATLEGKVLRAEKKDAAALAFYRTAIQNFPDHRALIYDYTDLLLQNNQPEIAVKLLTEQVSRHSSDTTLYDLQARAYAMQGKALEQHQAQAYSYAWQGNLKAAMEQLRLAKQAGGSFYQLSSIESDINELRQMQDAASKH